MATNITINYYNGSSYVELRPHAYLADTATSATSASSATTASSCSGNSATATKLATSRTIRTNLSSTTSASFNGTANITPGVTGTLGVSNGGTGVTSYSSLATQLSSYIGGNDIKHGYYKGTGSLNKIVTLEVGIVPKLFMLFPTNGYGQISNGQFTVAFYIIWYTGGFYNTIPSITIGSSTAIGQKDIPVSLSGTTFTIGSSSGNVYNLSCEYIWIVFS